MYGYILVNIIFSCKLVQNFLSIMNKLSQQKIPKYFSFSG